MVFRLNVRDVNDDV